MKTYLTILLTLIPALLSAQEWVSVYNTGLNDYSSNIVIDAKKNSFVLGITVTSDSAAHLLLVKYNPAGLLQWQYIFPNGSTFLHTYPGGINIDNSGNCIFSGSAQTIDSISIGFWGKLDGGGNLQFIKYYQHPGYNYSFGSIKNDISGNFYILANYNTMFQGGTMVLKCSPAGDTLWSNRNQGAYEFDFAVDDFQNIYVSGFVFNSFMDCITYKINASGTTAWTRIYGDIGSQWERGRSIDVSLTGDVYVAGNGVLDGGDIFLLKYDSEGTLTWSKTYNSPENYNDEVNKMILDNAENIYIAGVNETSSVDRILLLKYNSSGDTEWVNTYNYEGRNIRASDMEIDKEGNIVVTGSGQNTPDSSSSVLMIFNSSGNLKLQEEFGDRCGGGQLALDTKGDCYISGTLENNSGNYEIYTLKYSNPLQIKSVSSKIPLNFTLGQNYPNPFNPQTTIPFSLPHSGITTLVIYDLLGKEIKRLYNNFLHAGEYEITFNADHISSGIYFYHIVVHSDKLSSGNFTQTKKMNFIK